MFGDNNSCESFFQCAQYFILLDFVAIISGFYYSQVLFSVRFQLFFIIKSFISLYSGYKKKIRFWLGYKSVRKTVFKKSATIVKNGKGCYVWSNTYEITKLGNTM